MDTVHNGAGDADSLALAAGELEAAFATLLRPLIPERYPLRSRLRPVVFCHVHKFVKSANMIKSLSSRISILLHAMHSVARCCVPMNATPHSEILHTLIALSIVSGASVVGSISFALGRRLQAVLPYLVGAAAGALLGTAVTHMLPEAVERVGTGNRLSLLLITGFLISFLLERLLWILFRGKGGIDAAGHVHLPDKSFHHGHQHDHQGKTGLVGNILFGGAVHSFMDGIAIATSFLIGHNIGVATTVAVLLHEVPHHIADVGVLVYSGLTRTRAVVLNVLATFGCAVGGVLVLVFGGTVQLANNLLPVAAANFLYIAIGILLPELQKERSGRRSAIQIACLVLALWLIGGISNLASEQALLRNFQHFTLAHLMN